MMESTELLTEREVAALLRVAPSTVGRWAARGLIPVIVLPVRAAEVQARRRHTSSRINGVRRARRRRGGEPVRVDGEPNNLDSNVFAPQNRKEETEEDTPDVLNRATNE